MLNAILVVLLGLRNNAHSGLGFGPVADSVVIDSGVEIVVDIGLESANVSVEGVNFGKNIVVLALEIG